jgi:hypothetical protein
LAPQNEERIGSQGGPSDGVGGKGLDHVLRQGIDFAIGRHHGIDLPKCNSAAGRAAESQRMPEAEISRRFR